MRYALPIIIYHMNHKQQNHSFYESLMICPNPTVALHDKQCCAAQGHVSRGRDQLTLVKQVNEVFAREKQINANAQ